VEWDLANSAWVESVTSGVYQQWVKLNYAVREATGVEKRKTVTTVESAR